MIFVTVGSQLPFDRLVEAVDRWAAARGRKDVVAQVGSSEERFENLETRAALEPAEFDAHVQRAELIVGHAGTGTLMAALSAGRPVVMLARREALRETRNDHQVATVMRFADTPGVWGTADEQELAALLDEAVAAGAQGGSFGPHATGPLVDRLRGFLDTHLGAPQTAPSPESVR